MPQPPALETWLYERLRSAYWMRIAGAAGLFLGALAVLFITFWIIYAVIYLGFNWLVPHSHAVRLGIAAVVVVLLFIGNASTDRQYLESYSFTTGTHSDTVVTLDVPFISRGSTVNPLAPETVHSQAKMITSLLYTGPRMMVEAFHTVGAARRLARVDVKACTAVIAFLATKDARVTFAEVVPAIPRGENVVAVLEQLPAIDGVMFLRSEPPGVSLHSDFREEVRRHLPRRQQAESLPNEV